MRDPLTVFMNRRKHSTKFVIVGVAVVLAVSIPLYQLFAVQTAKIATARSELGWTRYGESMAELMVLMQEHEQAVISADRNEGLRSQNTATVTARHIDALITKIANQNKTLAQPLHVQGLWQPIVRRWYALKGADIIRPPQVLTAEYTRELSRIWSVLLLSSDYARFRDNRAPSSVAVVAAVRNVIPTMLAQLNLLRIALMENPENPEAGTPQSVEIRKMINLIYWGRISAIRHDLRMAMQNNPDYLAIINKPVTGLAADGSELAQLAANPGNFDRNTRFHMLELVNRIAANTSLISTNSMHWLHTIFSDQLANLRFWLLMTIGIAAGVALMMVVLFVSMYRSLISAIAERIAAEGRVQRVRDLYEALSKTNRLIADHCDQGQLFSEVCRIVVQLGHFDLALIAMVNPLSGRAMATASAGPAVTTYLKKIQSGDENLMPVGCQPAAGCISSGRPVIINRLDFLAPTRPWEVEAVAAGLKSAAAFPLVKRHSVVGALVIYCSGEERFDEQLTNLLTEISNSISFALEGMAREDFRRAADQALRDSEQRYHMVMEGAGDAILLVEGDGRIIEANSRAVDQLGYSREELRSVPVMSLFPRNQQTESKNRHQRILATGRTVDSSITLIRKDQGTIPVDAVESRVDLHGRQLILSIFRDVSERKAAEERIHHLAFHDALTGLPNRTLLMDRIEQSIREARRRDNLVGILFLDLDNFKNVNDTLGHDCGDELLQNVAMRMRNTLRSEDTLARLGGDEFIVLITDPNSPADMEVVAQKIIQAMSVPFVIAGHTFHITCSIGMSIFPRDGQDSGVLLRTADEALYGVKKEGRNRAAFHTPEMHRAAVESIRMENDLREAIRLNQFVLHYQPVVDLQTGRIISGEALIRWQHPERGLISPLQFIPMAEEKGLILALGEWVMHAACEQNRRWQLADVPVVPIAVNLSAVQCREPSLERTIQRILDSTGLAPSLLELEITEGTLMQQTEALRDRMLKIKKLGIRFLLDDFGTGYSSLSYLTRFPIDTLKIDSSFIRDMIDDPKDLAVVDTIVDLADNLQLRTIAEGVERVEQVTLLKLLGCQAMQGYHFSASVPADEFAKFLVDDRRLHDVLIPDQPQVISVGGIA